MKAYTSKGQIIEDLKNQLKSSKSQLEKGIQRIYEYQTSSEKVSRDVKFNNGVGFKPQDAYILSSFAQQLKRGYHLSEKQTYIAKKLMPKYAGQLVNQSIQKGLIVKTLLGNYVFAS